MNSSSPEIQAPARKVVQFGAAFLFVLTLLAWPVVAYANTIPVNGGCSLPDAIAAANTDAAVGGCTTGSSGSDTLVLDPVTYSLNTVALGSDGATATPIITTTVVISGTPGSIVQRSGLLPIRLFYVGVNGELTLQQVTVRYGNALDEGGGIYNNGSLTLVDSIIYSNTAVNGGGGISSNQAFLTIRDSRFVSNSAATGGALLNVSGYADIYDSHFVANHATDEGGAIQNRFTDSNIINTTFDSNSADNAGAIYNVESSNAIIDSSEFLSNTAAFNGAGLYNQSSTANITGSRFISNSVIYFGGAIHNEDNGATTITNSVFISNSASSGGGIYSTNASALTVTGLDFRGNHVSFFGGAISARDHTALTIADSHFISNSAQYGGAVDNEGGGAAMITNSRFFSNSASDSGGGLYNAADLTAVGAIANLRGSLFVGNRAPSGGGIYNSFVSTMTLESLEIRANRAYTDGGGIFNYGSMTITATKFLSNSAAIEGGSLAKGEGATTINQSCIVDNSDRAVVNQFGPAIEASHNWWGAPDGPSGFGPGSGDSVSENVTVTSFLNAAILDCPSRTTEIAFSKSASPTGILHSGDPLTFTLTITNEGAVAVNKLVGSDPLPSAFVVNDVITHGPVISVTGSSFAIPQLQPAQVATIAFVGQGNPALQSHATVTNTATLTQAVMGTQTASTTVEIWPAEVNLPTVRKR